MKAPQPGQVKTRLAATIGADHAVRLYENFVLDLMALLQTLPEDVQIYYAPAQARESVSAWLGEHHCYCAQTGVNLGERLSHAFQKAFAQGYQRVLALGSDSPDLRPAILKEGFQALEQQDCVLGPTDDGGYYAIGFTRQGFLPEVFQDIAWSTDTVLQTTLEILNRHARKVHQLPLGFDIDVLEDLWHFYNRNWEKQSSTHTMQYLKQHRAILFRDMVENSVRLASDIR